jgi:hypothetical protein
MAMIVISMVNYYFRDHLAAIVGNSSSSYAQAAATMTNQTQKTTASTPSDQASQSIRGAITDTV